MTQKNQPSAERKNALPSPAKKPYSKPEFRYERVFETLALACGKVHANHPIMGGHFARRRQIFKETLEFYQVDESIKAALLNHADSLRPLITPEAGSNCDPLAARERVNRR